MRDKAKQAVEDAIRVTDVVKQSHNNEYPKHASRTIKRLHTDQSDNYKVIQFALKHLQACMSEQSLENKQYPKLLSKEETDKLLKKSEGIVSDILENNLGGFSGINRPFWVLNAFKVVIEEYGNRDVGLNWSFDDLKNHPDQSKPLEQPSEKMLKDWMKKL